MTLEAFNSPPELLGCCAMQYHLNAWACPFCMAFDIHVCQGCCPQKQLTPCKDAPSLHDLCRSSRLCKTCWARLQLPVLMSHTIHYAINRLASSPASKACSTTAASGLPQHLWQQTKLSRLRDGMQFWTHWLTGTVVSLSKGSWYQNILDVRIMQLVNITAFWLQWYLCWRTIQHKDKFLGD